MASSEVHAKTAEAEPTKKTREETPPTKKPPDVLCHCPQKCHMRVAEDIRLGLYKEFSQLGDHYRQNQYLQSYIEMRSVYKRLWCQEERVGGRLQRRVSCKYRIPLDVPSPLFDTVQSHPKLHTNSKGKATYVVGIKEGVKTIEVCQKAFMNVYGITEKRIRLQREKLIAKLRSDTLDLKNGEEAAQVKPKAKPLQPQPQQHLSEEQYIVESFFRNQLWKPEYTGMSNEKLQYIDIHQNDIKV